MKFTLQTEQYTCVEEPSSVDVSNIPGVVRWFRRPYSLGGAVAMNVNEISDQMGNKESNVMAVVFEDPKVFLKLLRKVDRASDELPNLRDWVKKGEVGQGAASCKRERS